MTNAALTKYRCLGCGALDCASDDCTGFGEEMVDVLDLANEDTAADVEYATAMAWGK